MVTFVTLADHFLGKLPKFAHQGGLALIGIIFILGFVYFWDFTFGMVGPASNWASRQWLNAWNIY